MTPRQAATPKSAPALNRGVWSVLILVGLLYFPAWGAEAVTIKLRGVRFEGNRVVSDSELATVVKPWIGRQVTLDDLENVRQAVTSKYVEAGYVTSVAVLPEQDIADGVVLIRIIEGRLAEVRVHNATSRPVIPLRESFVRVRAGTGSSGVASGESGVLNVRRLQDRLEVLRSNPNISRLNATLRPEPEPGVTSLDVEYEQANPFHLSTEVSNHRPPSVGPVRVETIASCTNVTGNSDSLEARWTAFRGSLERMEFAEADEYSIDYSIPVTPVETALFAAMSRSDAPVVESPLESLVVNSRSTDYTIGIRQPLLLTGSRYVGVTVEFSRRDADSSVGGVPFSLSPGAVEGHSESDALRFGLEWDERSETQGLSLRSTVSVGVALPGATNHGFPGLADSQFVSWLGQCQYIRRLGGSGLTGIVRLTSQLTPDALLSPEQIAVGGIDTVRGYRENRFVRDNAVVGTLELRHPLLDAGKAATLELAGFIDYGVAWDSFPAAFTTRFQNISSTGVGVLLHVGTVVDLRVYYGYPFRDLGTHTDLQDIGVHFDLVVNAF